MVIPFNWFGLSGARNSQHLMNMTASCAATVMAVDIVAVGAMVGAGEQDPSGAFGLPFVGAR